MEEVVSLKEVFPCFLPAGDIRHHRQPLAQFSHDDLLGGSSDIVRGTHRWISWCDDRHAMATNLEELQYHCGGNGGWVQLADSGNKHGPGNTTWETKNIGVNGVSLSPKLDGSESQLEHRWNWHQCQDLVCDTGTVQGTKISFVNVSKKILISQCQVYWHLRNVQSGTDQIDINAVKFDLDDRDKGIRNTCDFIQFLSFSKQFLEDAEEIITRHVFRNNN
ncbi:hypothetical protein WICPIJ_002604 [Wickerhamomyces pijperi]|uniref:Uncharacterized protein n=1 Tax=Wickerhamomyces pijperi TaxID=599730 RepID=A0A9P8QBF7_WICPI|nr:hypothetical protein WICPIJ_002604 [Wickerhamomyces pijperi]